MAYQCSNCGNIMEVNIFLQISGQAICDRCGQILDVLELLNEEIEIEEGNDENSW